MIEEEADMAREATVGPDAGRSSLGAQPEDGSCASSRLRVNGKFFTRQGRRVRLQGVTYGPFAPDEANGTFPVPGRVAADFDLMHAGGINAIRTYHVPPEWLLDLSYERGLAVLAGVPWVDVPHRQHFG